MLFLIMSIVLTKFVLTSAFYIWQLYLCFKINKGCDYLWRSSWWTKYVKIIKTNWSQISFYCLLWKILFLVLFSGGNQDDAKVQFGLQKYIITAAHHWSSLKKNYLDQWDFNVGGTKVWLIVFGSKNKGTKTWIKNVLLMNDYLGTMISTIIKWK